MSERGRLRRLRCWWRAETVAAPPPGAQTPRCGRCRWFDDDRAAVERELPGLLVLSSAHGDSWGDAGLCRRHDGMRLPFHGCDDYEPQRPHDEARRPAAERPRY